MTHIVGGYPNMKECERIARTMCEAGVSFLEIQIPFSDPIADGSTIMAANQKALENGTTVEDCFELMKRLRKHTDTSLLFMTYYNIPYRYGLEKFCKKAKQLGCYGLIIPDIPIDEESHEHYIKTCKKHNLHPIQVISPITPERRLKTIAKHASGMVYCVSRYGTTGAETKLNPDLKKYLTKVRKHIKIPLALGFGISNKQQVEEAQKYADIVVIGSKMINLYDEGKSVKAFLGQM